MVPSDPSHRSTPAGATPDVSITSAVPLSSFVQRASRNRSHQSKITRKERAEESSRSSGQPTGMHDALKRPYICHTCGKRYAQPGGVMRHYRAKHNPNSCTYCGARWSRPYQYRDHLEKHHRDVDPDLVLGKSAGSRRRAKVIGRERPQNVSPHVVRHDRQSQVAPRCLPLMPTLPSVVKAPQVPLAHSSAEELAQLVNDVVDHSSRLPRALPGGSTTANCSSRPVTAHIPFPCPPVGGYYGDPVSAEPVFEPSGFIHPYH
jgi:DNA-directed RNA polymerase subunit RPC12/RpoP